MDIIKNNMTKVQFICKACGSELRADFSEIDRAGDEFFATCAACGNITVVPPAAINYNALVEDKTSDGGLHRMDE